MKAVILALGFSLLSSNAFSCPAPMTFDFARLGVSGAMDKIQDAGVFFGKVADFQLTDSIDYVVFDVLKNYTSKTNSGSQLKARYIKASNCGEPSLDQIALFVVSYETGEARVMMTFF